MRTLFGSLIFGAAALVAAPQIASAQVARPPVATYTTQQADNGKLVFEQTCAGCHSADLSGGEGPPLTGAPFSYTWNGQSVAGLIKFVQNNMPMSSPGTLTPESTLSVVSYILSRNKMAAGEAPLSATSSAVVLIPPGERR